MISDRSLRRVLPSDWAVALTGDLVRAVLWTLMAGVLLVWIAYYAWLARHMVEELNMNDFGKFYYSAQAFLAGADMYGPSPATSIRVTPHDTREFLNLNPPHFHLLVLPLVSLPPVVALCLWWAAGLGAFAASMVVIARELGISWSPSAAAWTLVALVLSSATGMVVITGQVTFLLMLAVTLSWRAARRGRWGAAAVWLGAAASVKPFLGLFVPFLLVTRRGRPAIAMVATAGACIAGGLAVFGLSAYVGWVGALSEIDWAWAPMNASVQGLLARTLDRSPLFQPIAYLPGVVRPLALAAGAAIAAAALVAIARDQSSDHVDRTFPAVVLTALLVSPLGWWYYTWLVAGPLLACWRMRRDRPSVVRDGLVVLSVPGLLLPLYVAVLFRDLAWWSLALGSIYFWSLFALWGAVVIDTRVRPSARA
jgi:hypothetical protein